MHRLILFALLMVVLVACESQPEDDVASTPAATLAAATTTPAMPVPTDTPATLEPTVALPELLPEEPELYVNIEQAVALRLPETWYLREGAPIRIASNPSSLDTLDVTTEDAALFIYSSRNDDFLDSLPEEMTAVDVAGAFVARGRLNSFGRAGELLLPFESTRINGLDAAVGALRLTTTDGSAGTAYITSVVGATQKVLLVALTVAPTAEAILEDINEITNSVELLELDGMRRTGRFVTTPATAAGTPDIYHTTIEAGTRLLLLLETDPESNGVLTLLDINGTELTSVNQGGNGVTEVLYFVAPVSAVYGVEVTETGGDIGTYTLHMVDVRPGTEPVQIFREQQYDPERPIEFTFFGTAGQPMVIYVEPLGTDASLMDPILEILDAETNFYARIDDRYQGEPEAIYFEPAADGNYMARVSGFFSERGTYRIAVVQP